MPNETPSEVAKQPSETAKPREHYPLLTSIRFFAAFGIVIHHFGGSIEHLAGATGEPFIRAFGAGVKFFFVLSGFILAYSYYEKYHKSNWHRSGSQLKAYYRSRFFRVYPIYFFALILSIPQLVKNIPIYGAKLSAFDWGVYATSKLTLTQAWLPTLGNNPPMLLAAWSLSCEAFFYLLFPFLFAFLDRSKTSTIWIVLVAAALFPFSLQPLYTANPEGLGGLYNDWFPPFRTGEFVLGMCAAFLAKRLGGFRPEWNRVLAWLAVPAMWISFGFSILPVRRFDDALDLLVVAAVLVSWLKPGDVLTKLLGTPFWTTLGSASYALYLLHGPVFGYLTKVKSPLTEELIRSNLGAFAIYSVIAVIASVLAYRFVEEPMNRKFRAAKPKVG